MKEMNIISDVNLIPELPEGYFIDNLKDKEGDFFIYDKKAKLIKSDEDISYDNRKNANIYSKDGNRVYIDNNGYPFIYRATEVVPNKYVFWKQSYLAE